MLIFLMNKIINLRIVTVDYFSLDNQLPRRNSFTASVYTKM